MFSDICLPEKYTFWIHSKYGTRYCAYSDTHLTNFSVANENGLLTNSFLGPIIHCLI